MITYEDLPHLTQGKSVAEIQLMYETLDDARIIYRESCRNRLIDFLKKENATEEHPFKLEMDLDSGMEYFMPGIGTTKLTALWLDDDNVWFDLDYVDGGSIDTLNDYELLQIIDELE